MAKGPDFTGGFGGYGPWPDNDVPFEEDPSPHYHDGYRNRMPGGGHYELPTDFWVDQIVYPDRPAPMTAASANDLDLRARSFRISVGNITGRRPGPSED